MKKNIKTTLALFILILLTAAAFAQNPGFAGNWQIDTTKTIFGEGPHWILPVSFKITQDGLKLSITRNLVDEQGSASSLAELLSPGDTTITTTASGLTRKAVLTWSTDKNTFTISSSSSQGDDRPSAKISEIWSLSDGGKTLVIDRSVEQANGLKYTIKAFYNRMQL